MRKRFRIVLAVLLVAVLGGLAWVVLRPREPSYQGRTLTAWLRINKNAGGYKVPEAKDLPQWAQGIEAVRTIGTDGIPTLLRLVAARNFPGTELAETAMQKLTGRPFFHNEAAAKHALARIGFELLGDGAHAAEPGLIGLCASGTPASRETAIECLYLIRSDLELIRQIVTTNSVSTNAPRTNK